MIQTGEKLLTLFSKGKLEVLEESLNADFSKLESVLQIFVSEIVGALPDFASEMSPRQMTICQTLELGFDQLRMSVERQRPHAMAIMERLQAIIARDVIRHSQGPGRLVLMEILQEAKVEILPVLRRALDESRYTSIDTDTSSKEDAVQQGKEMLKELAEHHAGDVFGLAHDLSVPLESLSPQDRSQALIMPLTLSKEPLVKDLAALFCLDADPEVRKTFLELLTQVAENLGTGNTLRRLIVIRGWLPVTERPLVDEAVRSLRKAGVECAPLVPAKNCEIVSSSVDGSGAWGLLGSAKLDSDARVFGVVGRVLYGIRDAWSHCRVTKKELRTMESQMKDIKKKIGGSISTRAAMLLVRHGITAGLNDGRVPSRDVLEISEILGCQEWLNPESSLGTEIQGLRERLQENPNATHQRSKVLASDDWSKHPVFESWFEDDATVDNIVKDVLGSRLQKLRPASELMTLAVDRVLLEVICERIAKWLECLLLLSFLSDEMSSPNLPAAAECLVLSDYLTAGGDARKLPFFYMMARRSVEASVARMNSGRGGGERF
jgi:hypothetical protein